MFLGGRSDSKFETSITTEQDMEVIRGDHLIMLIERTTNREKYLWEYVENGFTLFFSSAMIGVSIDNKLYINIDTLWLEVNE